MNDLSGLTVTLKNVRAVQSFRDLGFGFFFCLLFFFEGITLLKQSAKTCYGF